MFYFKLRMSKLKIMFKQSNLYKLIKNKLIGCDILFLKEIISKCKVKKRFFLIAILLSLIGAVFEGISMGLLIPTLEEIGRASCRERV